jgi:hypothetical protein
MLQLSEKDKAAYLAEALDPNKVTLVCGIHKYAYGSKKKPNFRCKQCAFVNSMGLIANTPPERRMEMLEMFEWTCHKLVEAAKNGSLTKNTLYKRPEVSIERGVN